MSETVDSSSSRVFRVAIWSSLSKRRFVRVRVCVCVCVLEGGQGKGDGCVAFPVSQFTVF